VAREEATNPGLWVAYKSARERAEVAAELLRVLEHDGVSLRELSRRMGTSLSQVRRLVDPKRAGSATVSSLSRFARATGRDLTVLIEYDVEKECRDRIAMGTHGFWGTPSRWETEPFSFRIPSEPDRFLSFVQVIVRPEVEQSGMWSWIHERWSDQGSASAIPGSEGRFHE
jgi:transcriptional regulator with XRE-family HTH domain